MVKKQLQRGKGTVNVWLHVARKYDLVTLKVRYSTETYFFDATICLRRAVVT